MKKLLSVLFTLVLSIGLFYTAIPTQTVKAATITVDGGGGGMYLTIQEAINNATSGDTIQVNPGTYNEWLTVDKTLTIVGTDRDTTILQASGISSLNGIDIENTDGVSISNLTIMNYRCGIYLSNANNTSVTNTRIIDNTGPLATDYCAIQTQNSDYCTFSGNIIDNNEFGILLRSGSDYNDINGNNVTDNNYGIRLNSSTYNTLSSNTISSTSTGSIGIFLEYNSNSNTITGNNSSNNVAHGLEIYLSSSNIVMGNTFSNNSINGLFLYNNADGNEINNNEIKGNGSNGVFINFNSTANIISSNTISNNLARGIYLFQNVTYTEIHDNTISNNPTGIYLLAAHNTTVYNNNFINNPIQARAYSSAAPVFNLAAPTGGNYWSNWITPDVDVDGFVDNPYVFPSIAQDNLPWTVQNGWLPNQPPVADAGVDQFVEADVYSGANVTLDGSSSSDPDSDPLTYAWTWGGGSDTGVNPTVFLPLGVTTVTLIVNDGLVDSPPDTVEITVQDTIAPVITINVPEEIDYLRTDTIVIDFIVADVASEVSHTATLDGVPVENGDTTDLLLAALGPHILTVNAIDAESNVSIATATFVLLASTDSIIGTIEQMLGEGLIDNAGIANALTSKINAAIAKLDQSKEKAAKSILKAFINQVNAQAGKHLTMDAAALLIADAEYLIDSLD